MERLVKAKRGIAAGVAVVALGGCAGLAGEHSPKALPKKISACAPNWAQPENAVKDQTSTHRSMQAGVAKLISSINAEAPLADDQVELMRIPRNLLGAAEAVLQEGTDSTSLTTADIQLSSPAAEFCTADDGLHVTPAYVAAAGALQSAGIEVTFK